jgi:hypothetical protein
MSFKKAERKAIIVKLAICGPSGSGKTFSALRLASGLGKKIALIDTEDSASLYSDRFDFDVLELTPPYTVQKYLDAINMAVKNGYEVLVVDSISHQWSGEGGILSKKESIDGLGGNPFTNWAKVNPDENRFVSAIVHSDIHLIATMRAKTAYEMQTNDKGKVAPQKIGLAPIQKDGLEYEFTTVFDVAMNHYCKVSKDRTGIFIDKIFQITEDTGNEIKKWLQSAKPEDKNVKALHGATAGTNPSEKSEQETEESFASLGGTGSEELFVTYGNSEVLQHDSEPDQKRNEANISLTQAKDLYLRLEKQKRNVDKFHEYLQKTYSVPAASQLKQWQLTEVNKMIQG